MLANSPTQLHPEDNLAKYIRWSLVAHALVLAVFILRAVFYPSDPILIQHAIRVDMVGLPTKSQVATPLPSAPAAVKPAATPKPVEPAPIPKPVAPKKALPDVKKLDPKKVDLRKSTNAEEDAIKRLEALKKLAEMEKARSEPKAATPIRGAVLAAGSAITGLNKIDYDDYLDKLNEKVKSNWNLPSLLKNRDLTATIVVYIDSSGNVIKKEIKKSSGNSVFDEKCLEAIERSSPFNGPPSKLTNILAVDGIEFGFPD